MLVSDKHTFNFIFNHLGTEKQVNLQLGTPYDLMTFATAPLTCSYSVKYVSHTQL